LPHLQKAEPEHRPFCSARCKDIDLSKWLIGGYVIANDDESDSSEVETKPAIQKSSPAK
jgi:endogenous inhibitor of DNA gyrase (YacG/DUF329 family)